MPVRYKRVVVDAWCPNPADSRSCCTTHLGMDQSDVDKAIVRVPWTSLDLLKSTANAFKKCIDDCGGKARVVDA
ncbi:MAG: hypothetical protein KF773_24165 [Deltaproteobacteria bacterium]|nr:hypothetical protein [Deltaproteobacteria bacterium]